MTKPVKSQKKVTTVWLDAEQDNSGDPKRRMFFCFNCRVPLLQYQGKVMTIVPGNQPYHPSTLIKCKGSVRRDDGVWEECGQYYVFMDSVFTKEGQES